MKDFEAKNIPFEYFNQTISIPSCPFSLPSFSLYFFFLSPSHLFFCTVLLLHLCCPWFRLDIGDYGGDRSEPGRTIQGDDFVVCSHLWRGLKLPLGGSARWGTSKNRPMAICEHDLLLAYTLPVNVTVKKMEDWTCNWGQTSFYQIGQKMYTIVMNLFGIYSLEKVTFLPF